MSKDMVGLIDELSEIAQVNKELLRELRAERKEMRAAIAEARQVVEEVRKAADIAAEVRNDEPAVPVPLDPIDVRVAFGTDGAPLPCDSCGDPVKTRRWRTTKSASGAVEAGIVVRYCARCEPLGDAEPITEWEGER